MLNTIVGAGIFGLPSVAYALAGSYSLLAYLVCAVPVILIILCFAEVASRFRETGGPYLYARVAFGPVIGFEVGWLIWLGRVTAFAAICNLFVSYLGYFLPAVGAGSARSVAIVAVVSCLTIINVAGVRMTTRVNNFFTLGKLIPLVLFAGAGLFFIDVHQYSFAEPAPYSSFSKAALQLFFAYTGFEVAIISAGETRDPQRDVPFALVAAIAIVVVVYVTVQAVCIGVLPTLAMSERPLADAALRFLGPKGAVMIALGALLSTAGTMNATILAMPRVLYGMAEQRQLPRILLATHPRFRTPHIAIVISAGLMLAFTLFSTFLSALTIATIIRLLVYISTCAALPVLRRNTAVPKPTFVVPAGPVIAVAACVLSAWLLSNSTWTQAVGVAIAAAVGLVAYLTANPRRV